jgi:hypothetical protein
VTEPGSWVDPNTHGWVERPSNDGEWQGLIAKYGKRVPEPLAQVVRVVRESGCRTVVIENRYVDPDYRSEYTSFWAKLFDDHPAFARRLHFFSEELDDTVIHDLPSDAGYLGYTVVRPVDHGPLGRTMVAPPPSLGNATLTLALDTVTLFGNKLSVNAAPFCQQDTEYLRCAHAAAWMCHYASARRDLVARQWTAAFVDASPAILSHERSLPSKGLTLNQLQAVFGAFGQPALFYGLGLMPRVAGVDDPTPPSRRNKRSAPGFWDTRISSVVCRYLNSGYPVLIATDDHAFVIVGWFRDDRKDTHFVVNDDQEGPYKIVDCAFTDHRAPWRSIMVPLPPKVLLSAEAAENIGHKAFSAWRKSSSSPAPWRELAEDLAKRSLGLRTVLHNGSDWKEQLTLRGLPDEVVRVLRLARLPHYVWAVEAHDLQADRAGNPSVVGEILFDSTSHELRPRLDAILLPGAAFTLPPGGGTGEHAMMPIQPWMSSLPARTTV